MKKRLFNHKELDQLQKLKKENEKLKRTVSQLRKELDRIENRYSGLDDLVQQQYEEQFPKKLSKTKQLQDDWMCHKCKEDYLRIIIINRPDGTFYLRKCGSCTNKTRLKKYHEKVQGIVENDNKD